MNERPSQETARSQGDRLGKVLLVGSGETSASGHEMHQRMFLMLARPISVAILETPAGFELNSPLVAGRVGDFLKASLSSFSPHVAVIPACRRDGPFSTNNADLLSPMLEANYIFLGAGSPTYLVRHAKDTLAMDYLVGRHRRGAALALASAAAIAFSAKTLPVYEIFKAGHDPHWVEGLDFFGPFGLELAVVTHWDNQEGGAHLDTSHCFMGRSRMEQLRRLLPPTTLVLGIDEHTGISFDFQAGQCHVMGKGGVTLLAPGSMEVWEAGSTFPIQRLGPYHPPPEAPEYGPPVEWCEEWPGKELPEVQPEPPPEVLELIQKREAARQARDWAQADAIRRRVAEMGFGIQDTREGPRCRYQGGRGQG